MEFIFTIYYELKTNVVNNFLYSYIITYIWTRTSRFQANHVAHYSAYRSGVLSMQLHFQIDLISNTGNHDMSNGCETDIYEADIKTIVVYCKDE